MRVRYEDERAEKGGSCDCMRKRYRWARLMDVMLMNVEIVGTVRSET